MHAREAEVALSEKIYCSDEISLTLENTIKLEETCRSVDAKVLEIISQVKEQSDPTLRIDQEYRNSADACYVWKASRLFPRSANPDLWWLTNTKDLEELASSITIS